MTTQDLIPLSEADIKRAVTDYLQIAENQGKLFFLRLNSGEIIEARGDTRRRVKLCPPGTADFVVFQPATITVQYKTKKSPFPFGFSRVTFIELKKRDGKQSPAQVEFESKVKRFHCHYVLANSVDEVMSQLGIAEIE